MSSGINASVSGVPLSVSFTERFIFLGPGVALVTFLSFQSLHSQTSDLLFLSLVCVFAAMAVYDATSRTMKTVDRDVTWWRSVFRINYIYFATVSFIVYILPISMLGNAHDFVLWITPGCSIGISALLVYILGRAQVFEL